MDPENFDFEDKFYTFYDPLYEIKIYNALSGGPLNILCGGDVNQKLNEIFCAIIDSHELNRLNFIKQTGLSWLVFPSSTHTLFSHSLGKLVLGEYALKNIVTKSGTITGNSGKTTGNLDDWLTDINLKDEFFLALLLSDIGQLPFSNLLQKNKCFSDYDHKKVAVQLIKGEGDAYAFFKNRFGDTIHDILKAVNRIDLNILCYLIDHEKQDESEMGDDVEILYNIVNGKLGLDRLDRYRRDSYFIGTKFATFDMRSLLRDVYIDLDSKCLKFNKDGIKYAYQLLTNKDMLLSEAFENPINISYSAMMDYSTLKYFESLKTNDAKELPFLTDERVLYNMMQEGSISELVNRILNRKPYLFKEVKINLDSFNEIEQFLLDFISKFDLEEKDVLLYPLEHFEYDVDDQWLNLECFGGKRLFEQENYSDLIKYMNKKQVEHKKQIYFFVSDSSKLHLLENEMKNNNAFF